MFLTKYVSSFRRGSPLLRCVVLYSKNPHKRTVNGLNPIQTGCFLLSLDLGIGEGLKEPPPVTFFQLKLSRTYFDNSQFIPSLFNFHLASNDMTSNDVTITSLLSKF